VFLFVDSAGAEEGEGEEGIGGAVFILAFLATLAENLAIASFGTEGEPKTLKFLF
jgi:hypothetical protein